MKSLLLFVVVLFVGVCIYADIKITSLRLNVIEARQESYKVGFNNGYATASIKYLKDSIAFLK